MQHSHAAALNQLAEVVLGSDEAEAILEAMARVVGTELQVDRSLVFDVRMSEGVTTCCAEWLRPALPSIVSARRTYPLSIFGDASSALFAERQIIVSHRSAPNPVLGPAGWSVLHEDLGVGTVLWLPFAFREDGFHLLAFNHLTEHDWVRADLAFIDAVRRQVSLALVKLELVAQRRKTLDALAASEARYRALFDMAPSMVFIVRRDLRVAAINRFARELLGYSEREAVGQDALAFIVPEDRPLVRDRILRCFEEPGRVIAWEARGVTRDGSVRHASQTARATHDPSGELVIFINSVDITEQKRTEQALLQTQKLETLGVLVGGIAHDFNNLLGTIAGNADLALMKIDVESPARGPVEKASLASQRAAELVKQLLSYSAKAPVARTPVELNEIVRELTALLEVTIGRRARMHLDLAEPLPAVVGDATQLRQVLLNLVHNAADAIAELDGEVRIATRVLRGRSPADVRVQLSVRDTGVGIEPENLERIFEVFYTTKVAGRGLGLSAVRTIADRHGGTITVESRPGHGATFTLVLPAAESAPTAESAPIFSVRADSSPPSRGAVIFVVDDERPLLDVVSAFIEEFGDVPLAANTVGEAQATFAEHPEIACALLDLTMPSGGGAVLARAFKAARPEVPIVLMSGFAHSDVTEALGPLLDAVIAKPFKPAELEKVLARVLGR